MKCTAATLQAGLIQPLQVMHPLQM